MRGTGEGIVVAERDNTYKYCNALLSAGGMRQQFSLTENIKMSMYGMDLLRSANENLSINDDDDPVDVQFHESGYLFLAASEEGRATLLRNHETQHNAGADWIKLFSPEELASRFDWLNTSDLTMGSLGLEACVFQQKKRMISLSCSFRE